MDTTNIRRNLQEEVYRWKAIAGYLASCHAATLEGIPKAGPKWLRTLERDVCTSFLKFSKEPGIPALFLGSTVRNEILKSLARCKKNLRIGKEDQEKKTPLEKTASLWMATPESLATLLDTALGGKLITSVDSEEELDKIACCYSQISRLIDRTNWAIFKFVPGWKIRFLSDFQDETAWLESLEGETSKEEKLTGELQKWRAISSYLINKHSEVLEKLTKSAPAHLRSRMEGISAKSILYITCGEEPRRGIIGNGEEDLAQEIKRCTNALEKY